MIRVAVVGTGKMGISHLAMVRALSNVELVGVCDSAAYVLDVLAKYTGLATFTDFRKMLDTVAADAIVIATPSASHIDLIREALDRGLHVFCEKPLTLSASESAALAERASIKKLVTQVGYHNRFVGSFQEVKRLLEAGAIGTVSHALAESYGPVVLRSKGSTWRSKRTAGGGCLYDYAAHPLDLLTWYFGEALSAEGTVIGQIFSSETDDEVYSTLRFPAGVSSQLSVNWSDDSQRKMITKISIWGTQGKIVADRQECQVYLRDTSQPPAGYRTGWNTRYTTSLTNPVQFYLRGEEYSAQLEHFVLAVAAAIRDETGSQELGTHNDFRSAAATDRVIEMVLSSANTTPTPAAGAASPGSAPAAARRRSLFGGRSARSVTQ